jgi:hypothetical protein
MALEMRAECERCRQPLCPEDVAFVCSFECTYCSDCAEVLGGICETCTGELVRRPRRRTARATAPPVAAGEQQLPVVGAMQRSSSTPLADR